MRAPAEGGFPSSALSALERNGCLAVVIAREEAATESTCHAGLAPLSFARWQWYDDGPTHVTVQGLEPAGFLGPLLPRRGAPHPACRPAMLVSFIRCDPSSLPAASDKVPTREPCPCSRMSCWIVEWRVLVHDSLVQLVVTPVARRVLSQPCMSTDSKVS